MKEPAKPTLPATPAVPTMVPGETPFRIGPSGYTQVASSAGHLRFSLPPGGGCRVDVRWWRPRPNTPGRPMVVASTSEVTALGAKQTLLRTSSFDGVVQQVDVLMLPASDSHTRIVFENCGPSEIEQFLASLSPR